MIGRVRNSGRTTRTEPPRIRPTAQRGYGRNPWAIPSVRQPCTNGLPGYRQAARRGDPAAGAPTRGAFCVSEALHAVPPEPDMVQLLTPEGVRVEHPDYPLDITDDEIKSLYRDLVLV